MLFRKLLRVTIPQFFFLRGVYIYCTVCTSTFRNRIQSRYHKALSKLPPPYPKSTPSPPSNSSRPFPSMTPKIHPSLLLTSTPLSFSLSLTTRTAIPKPKPFFLSSLTRLHVHMSSEPKRAAKRFAPLDPNVENSAGAPPLKGIVFDVDGTLWCVVLRCVAVEFYVIGDVEWFFFFF